MTQEMIFDEIDDSAPMEVQKLNGSGLTTTEQQTEINNNLDLSAFASALSNLSPEASSKALEIYERIFFREREERARISFTRDFVRMAEGLPELDIRKDKRGQVGQAQIKYVDLATSLPKIQQHISKFGFSIHHEVSQNLSDNTVTVTAILSHVEGHSRTTSMTGDVENIKNSKQENVLTSVQAVSKAATQLKRQTAFALIGVVGRDDDSDGAIVVEIDEVFAIKRRAQELGVNEQKFFDVLKVKGWDDVWTVEKVKQANTQLRQKKDQMDREAWKAKNNQVQS